MVQEPKKVQYTMTAEQRMQNEMFQMGSVHTRQRRSYD